MRHIFLLAFCLGLALAGATPASSQIGKKDVSFSRGDGPNRTDRLIVKLRDRNAGRARVLSAGQVSALSSAAGIHLTHHRSMSGGSQVLRLPRMMTIPEAQAYARKLSADAGVEYAEPDQRKWAMAAPNDPGYSLQWHYKAFTSEVGGANLPAAWDVTQGAASVVVAVLDTGLVTHADMAGRTVAGYDFITDVPTANDGGGRDADPSDPGDWVTAGESATVGGLFQDCTVQDSTWHGTHVAGTIGALTNNSAGVAGVNWNSKIQPVRVLGKCGGYDSDIIDGMRWAAGLAVSGVTTNATPAKVINMSLGGTNSCSASYQAAINEIIAVGVIVVVAAGNSNVDAVLSSPGNCSGVITVGATARNGAKASYSNHGPALEISAPGGDTGDGVYSLGNSGLTSPDASPGGDSYVYKMGTSMATPHISGIVSLMASLNPSLTPAEALFRLQATARAFPTGTGNDCSTSYCGAGIVDAAAAISYIHLVAPSLTGAAQSASSILWSWTSDGSVCPAALTYTLINASDGTVIYTGANLSTTETFVSQPNQLKVRAVKAVCQAVPGPLSPSASVYIQANPPLANSVVPSAVSESGALITWNQNGNPAYTRYLFSFSQDGTFATGVSTPISIGSDFRGNSYALTGLSAGTTYFARVQAFSGRSSDGYGGTGTVFVGTSFTTLPLAPDLSGAGAYNSILWSWTQRPGALYYTLYNEAGSVLYTGGALSFPQTGLTTNTQYTARVEAVSGNGAGPRNSATTFTLANNPTLAVVNAIHFTSITYSWNGGLNPAYTFYEIEVTTNSTFEIIVATLTVDKTTVTATGLFPGTNYFARVRSINGGQIFGTPVGFVPASTLPDSTITVVPTPSSAYVSPYNTVGQWNFDESTGVVAADSSGFGNTAYLTCMAATCTSTPTFVAGPSGLGSAVSFPGLANSLVSVPDAVQYNFNNDLTVSAWVNPSSLSQYDGAGIVVHGNGGVENFALDVSGGLYRFEATPVKIVSSTNSIVVGAWTHLIGVYDSVANTATLYVNGRPASTVGGVPLRTAAAHAITIGNRQSGATNYDRGFLGSIDAVRVQNRALSAAEALAEYQGSFVSTLTPPSPNNTVLIGLPPNAFGAPATIFVSADPILHPIRITPAALNAGLTVIPTGYTLVPNSVVEIVPVVNGTPFTQTLGSSATISMPYADADGNNVIDNTSPPLSASAIRVYTLNTTVNRWEALPAFVDPVSRRVTVYTPHFSVFAMFSPLTIGTSLAEVRIYPIPWKPGTRGRFDAAGITFDRLPVSGTVRILSLAGERLREFSFDGSASGSASWNGMTDGGQRAASGVYFARITGNDGAASLVKFAIER